MRFRVLDVQPLAARSNYIHNISRRDILKKSGLIIVCGPSLYLPPTAASAGALARLLGRIVKIRPKISLGDVIDPLILLINNLEEESTHPVNTTVIDSDGDEEDSGTISQPVPPMSSISVVASLEPTTEGKKKFKLQTGLNLASANFSVGISN